MNSAAKTFFTICSAAVLLFAGVAAAYTGKADSAAGALDTVGPTVVSAHARTGRVIEVVFSEPMLEPSVTTPESYVLTGDGAGTLAAQPSTVSGSGPYTLVWDSGEMAGGLPMTVTVSGVQDVAGNLIAAPNGAEAVRMPLAWWLLFVTLLVAAAGRLWRARPVRASGTGRR